MRVRHVRKDHPNPTPSPPLRELEGGDVVEEFEEGDLS